MKVIAIQSDTQILVSMSLKELANLAGFKDAEDCLKTHKMSLYLSNQLRSDEERKNILKIEDIPISSIYQDAKATLSAFSDLKTRLESVRNQLTTLTKKMEILNPIKDN